ncbi:MAG: hypothetical protein IKF56_02035 [Eggerthellaceae bacterium]|nr:hypothetical protein [Eggerthellaceae bacterium]
MVCYGGACEKTCPMFEIHNPRIVECEACGKSALSWYVKEGLCPDCYNSGTREQFEDESSSSAAGKG